MRRNFPVSSSRGRWVSRLLSALTAVGVFLALYPLAQNVYTFWNQRTLKNELAAAQKQRFLQTSTRSSGSRQSNRQTKPKASRAWPLTRISCPEIGLDAIVVSGQSEDALRRGPGHDPRTAFPGEKGNCVIAAHRNTYGSHFMRVDELLPGSVISLQTPDATHRYSVVQTYTVADTDTHIRNAPSDPNSPPLLTLFTCTIPRTASRVVVVAQLVRDDTF